MNKENEEQKPEAEKTPAPAEGTEAQKPADEKAGTETDGKEAA